MEISDVLKVLLKSTLTEEDDKKEFKSLVTDVEVKKWKDMHEDFEKYVEEVHIPLTGKVALASNLTNKQMAHHMMYMDLVSDFASVLSRLAHINDEGVKALEEVHRKGVSYGEIMMQLLIKNERQ